MTYTDIIDTHKWFKILDVDDNVKNTFCLAKTVQGECCEVLTTNFKLICSVQHMLIDKDGNQIPAIDSLNTFVKTKHGIEKVICVKKMPDQIFYDIQLDGDHLYDTNGIQSHNCVILDEAAYIEHPEDVLAAIAPTLTRDPNSELIMASTPAGKNSWFYKQYLAALNDPNWFVMKTSIQDAITEGLNVDINSLKSLTPDPDVWKMEYEAEFLSEYASMIDINLLQFMPREQMPRNKNVVGMDIGSTSDRTAIAIVSIDNDIFYVYDVITLHKASYEEQLQILQSLHKQYAFQNGFIDANGIGNPIAEFANKRISARIKAFTWTSANKTPAFEYMRSKIFDRQLFFAEHLKPLIISDFQNVQRIITADGNIKYVAGRDENGHSDATSALVLALQAAKQLKTIIPPTALYNGSRLF